MDNPRVMNRIIGEDVDSVIANNSGLLRKLDGQNVLVSGGAGFLGAYFVDLLARWNRKGAAAPCEIYAMDTFITGTPKRLAHLGHDPHAHIVSKSVTEPLGDEMKFGYILHFASIASPTFYRKHPIETIDANVGGTRNLLEYAARNGIRSMLYLSTSEIYGDPPAENIPTREEYRGNVSCTGPRACYDESKRMGETLCVNFFRTRGVPVKIARPFNIYGPGLRLDDKRVIPDLFTGALSSREIIMHSDGKPTRSFCYVSDAVDAFVKILLSDQNGESFNVGNDSEEVTMAALAGKVAGLFEGVRVVYKKSGEADYLADNPYRRCPNLEKSRRLVGYEPKVPLDAGLARLKRWYEEQLKEA